jgi:hypothetical protein
MAISEERKAWGKVVAKAWNDPQFKAQLLANPKPVLAQNGVKIPDNVEVKIEDGGNTLTLPLPKKPAQQLGGGEEGMDDVIGYSSSGCCWH